MKLKHVFLAAAAVALSWQLPALAESADVTSARQLLDKYYAATRKAKTISDVAPMLTKRNQERIKTNPVPPEMEAIAMDMVRNSVPTKFKITSEKEEKDRVTFVLSATDADFPKDGMMSMPQGVVAHGEFIAQREGGEWKVDKDYWTAASPDGSFKMSFGTNPDKKDKEASDKPAEDKSVEAKEPESKAKE